MVCIKLVDSLEAKKQELEARLNRGLQSAQASETQKLNDAGNALKTQLIAELTEAKNKLKQELEAFLSAGDKVMDAYRSIFETSFLNNASFRNLTTQSIPTTYNNDWVFYKHSQALVYEILK